MLACHLVCKDTSRAVIASLKVCVRKLLGKAFTRASLVFVVHAACFILTKQRKGTDGASPDRAGIISFRHRAIG